MKDIKKGSEMGTVMVHLQKLRRRSMYLRKFGGGCVTSPAKGVR